MAVRLALAFAAWPHYSIYPWFRALTSHGATICYFSGEQSLASRVMIVLENMTILYRFAHVSRLQIVQYVRLVRPDSASQDASFITSSGGGPHPWYSGSGFGGDVEEGHGTHTAGSAAGATLNDPAVTATCDNNTELGCVGGCFNDSYIVTLNANGYYPLDFDTWCPQHDCDGYGADFEICLDEDIAARLTANGGIAQGAKLSIFDASSDGYSIWPALAGNDLWKLTEETGCMLHSNSWGGDSYCTVTSDCAIYDQYMYEVRAFVHR